MIYSGIVWVAIIVVIVACIYQAIPIVEYLKQERKADEERKSRR